MRYYNRLLLYGAPFPRHEAALASHNLSGNYSVDAVKVSEPAIIAMPTILSIRAHMTSQKCMPSHVGRVGFEKCTSELRFRDRTILNCDRKYSILSCSRERDGGSCIGVALGLEAH
jgi:hypothetical protein